MKLSQHLICVSLLTAVLMNANCQLQMGSDIDGLVGNEESGFFVSMPDAYTVASGAPYSDANGTNAGLVRIYEWNTGAWVQKGADIQGEAANDQSGWNLSMPDSKTVAVGAPFNDGNGNNAGHVRIYDWTGINWQQRGNDIDGEWAGNQSGFSVSMGNTNTIAIGAPYNHGNGMNSGHVRVYEWNGSAWLQKGDDIDGETANGQSGFTVSMPDSSTVAVGAPYNNGGGGNAGHVRIYKWNGTTWVQKGGDIDGELGDFSGISVSMPDSNTVAVGAPYNNENGSNAGRVRIYEWQAGNWQQKGSDLYGQAAGDYTGVSVSMPDANTVAVGAGENDSNGTDAGQVRVYSWNGSAWIQIGTPINGEAAGDGSGFSVSMPDAFTVGIGAAYNDANGINSGQVRVFNLCASAGIDVQTACNNFTWIDGNTYTASNNTATYMFMSGTGCDSIITLNLTINTVSDLTTSTNDSAIVSNNTSATYVWLDCDNDFTPIVGETAQSFTVTSNGNYAVQLTENGCVDTTACFLVDALNLIENSLLKGFTVYPNPTEGSIWISFDEEQGDLNLSLFSVTGQLIKRESFESSSLIKFDIEAQAGMYLLKVSNTSNQETVIRVLRK